MTEINNIGKPDLVTPLADEILRYVCSKQVSYPVAISALHLACNRVESTSKMELALLPIPKDITVTEYGRDLTVKNLQRDFR